MTLRRLPTWREMHMDTSPEIEAMQFAFYRDTPVWRKLQMVSQLNRMARTMAMSGLRRRHPKATNEELQRYLADMLLGPELAAQVYGSADRGEQEELRKWAADLNVLDLLEQTLVEAAR